MSKNTKSNSIRIIAGKWRGRRLPVLDAKGLRPTTDRVRETLFNWLMHDVVGSRCLDVFAGSGALGLECLSRGGNAALFIESNAAVAKNLQHNIDVLEANAGTKNAEVSHGDAFSFLSQKAADPFDIVFLDPPFKDNVIEKCVELLEINGWLSASALVYIECEKRIELSLPPHWKLSKEGSTVQSKYQLYYR